MILSNQKAVGAYINGHSSARKTSDDIKYIVTHQRLSAGDADLMRAQSVQLFCQGFIFFRAQLICAGVLPALAHLAAAIAAGDTPSPEMVAASGGKEGLRPAVAWGLLVFIIVGTLAIIAMNSRARLLGHISFDKSPDALVELSRQFLDKAGYPVEAANHIYGFITNDAFIRYMEESVSNTKKWKKSGSKAILFWYRQSPGSFIPRMISSTSGVGPNNPPLLEPGEILLILDTEGHLVSFRAIPPESHPPTGETQKPDWTLFFNEAGLNMTDWNKTDAGFTPSSQAAIVSA